MKACETLAQQEPFGSMSCRAITVNTVVRKALQPDATISRGRVGTDEQSVEDWVDEGGRNIWEVLGGQRPSHLKRWDKGAWYQRLGFVPFGELPFEWDESAKFVYFRKELAAPKEVL